MPAGIVQNPEPGPTPMDTEARKLARQRANPKPGVQHAKSNGAVGAAVAGRRVDTRSPRGGSF